MRLISYSRELKSNALEILNDNYGIWTHAYKENDNLKEESHLGEW